MQSDPPTHRRRRRRSLSSSVSGDERGDRPRQRQRLSQHRPAANPQTQSQSHSHSVNPSQIVAPATVTDLNPSPTSSSDVIAAPPLAGPIASSELPPPPPRQPTSSEAIANMGHPIPSSNGLTAHNSNGASAEAGPSTNGSTRRVASSTARDDETLSRIELVQPEGSLMYEDDRDWNGEPADLVPEDHDMEQGDGGAGVGHGSRSRQGKRMPVEREEVVRLILQGLRDIGYHQSADALEAESGYQLSIPAAVDFQNAILGGRWSEAIGLLPELGIDMPASSATAPSAPSAPSEDPPASSSNSFMSMKTTSSAHSSPAHQAKFSIAQQKYLEYLELGQQKKALNTLRQELAPVVKDAEVLHTLSGYMMCLDKDDLYERAAWDGAAGTSRRRLLEHLQTFISPQLMVPQRRLATLLEQARQYQSSQCVYHQDYDSPSLYIDHKCSDQFPSITTHVLADHTDEVWRIEWSPDGMMLASAGKDKQVVIWQLESMPKSEGGSSWSVRPLHHLRDHRDPVDVMAWSPDGQTLVTGADRGLYLWNTRTGLQKTVAMGASPHTDQISAIQWKPDGSEFLVSSMDCKLVFYSPSGVVNRQWSFNHLQINDFVITPDASRIVAVTTSLRQVPMHSKLKPSSSVRNAEGTRESARMLGLTPADFEYGSMEHTLMIIRLADKEVIDWSDNLRCEVTGLKLSWDGLRILINCNPDEVQMWSIEPLLRPIRNFKGHVQNHFLIRSSFGAPKDRFVLSGSEDNHVYVWKADNPHPVQVLAGHDSTVNCVAWNPVTSRRLFASCSDDSTVRIWQPPEPLDEAEARVAAAAGIIGDGGVSTNGNGNGLGGGIGEVKVEAEDAAPADGSRTAENGTRPSGMEEEGMML